MSARSSSKEESIYPEIRQPTINDKDKDANASTKNGGFSTQGVFNYVDESVSVAHVRRAPNGDDLPMQVAWKPVQVAVQDARKLASSRSPTLHVDGCELVQSPLREDKALRQINFMDSAAVMDTYYPACVKLVQERLGKHHHAVQVTAFDHNIRMAQTLNGCIDKDNDDSKTLKNSGGSTVQVPLGIVHGDYTAISAPRRLQDLAKPPKQNDVWRQRLSEGETLLNADTVAQALAGHRRYAFINVWRSIDTRDVVSSYPLAFCQAQTVKPTQLRTLQIHYADRIGENYLATYNGSHSWCYFPQMTADEVLLIKQWDSKGNLAMNNNKHTDDVSTFALHSAFGLPNDRTATSLPKPRKSIEVRCVCIWEPENSQQENNDEISNETRA